MIQTLLETALIMASLLLGTPQIPKPPDLRAISYQTGKEMSGGVPARALYDQNTKTVYIVLDSEDPQGFPYSEVETFVTLTHEMVHHIQTLEGRIYTEEERKKHTKVECCDNWFKIEMEALDVEDQLRKQLGMKKADRFAYYLIRQACKGELPNDAF